MNKKKYVLRNGLIIEPTGDPESGDVRIVSVPTKLEGEWRKGDDLVLLINEPDFAHVLSWTGGAFGKGYDVVRELEGG